MRARTALKIYRTIQEYKNCNRPDMPYTGAQVSRAAIRILPLPLRRFYRGWHKVTKAEGRREFLGNAVEVTIARKWCEALCRAVRDSDANKYIA